MKYLTRWLVGLAATVLAVGVRGAAPGEPATVPDGKALVYVYFVHGSLQRKPTQDIFVNGERLIKIQPGSFCSYEAEPGRVELADQPDAATGAVHEKGLNAHTILDLSVQAGQTYYVEWVYVNGFPRGAGSFRQNDRGTAMKVIDDSVRLEAETPGTARAVAIEKLSAAAERPAPVASGAKHDDVVLTRDCAIKAETAEEKTEVDALIAFLKEEKESRDFEQIAKIEFVSADRVKVVFTWYGGKHLGTLTVVKEAGGWKVTRETHAI